MNVFPIPCPLSKWNQSVRLVSIIIIRSINLYVFTGVDFIGVMNEEDTITISWVDYNFTSIITYCVNVVQVFGSDETSLLVSSECGLTETVYTFTSPGHGLCDTYNFTVTPTDGVNNGTSNEPVTGYFTQARGGLIKSSTY